MGVEVNGDGCLHPPLSVAALEWQKLIAMIQSIKLNKTNPNFYLY